MVKYGLYAAKSFAARTNVVKMQFPGRGNFPAGATYGRAIFG